MEFHPQSFLDTLPYLGKGMLGIFLVMGILILAVCLLNAVGGHKGTKQ